MAKTNHTNYANLTLLLGVLIFTLSAIAGFNSEAEVGTITLSSMGDCDTLGATLYTESTAECHVDVKYSNGNIVKQKVKAKKSTKAAVPQWGQPAPAAGLAVEIVELETEAQAPCMQCGGVRKNSAKQTVEASQKPDLGAIAKSLVQETVRKLAAETKADAARIARVERCEEDEQGQKIEGMPQIMDCRVDKIKGMDPRKAEAYYDNHIRKQLQEMISGGESLRASNSVATLKENIGSSVYLDASVKEMIRFGLAHQKGDEIISLQGQLAGLPASSRERRALQTQIAGLQGKFNAERAYLASRGMQINQQLTGAVEQTLVTPDEDMDDFEKKVEDVAQSRQTMTGPGTTPPRGNRRPEFPQLPAGVGPGATRNQPTRPNQPGQPPLQHGRPNQPVQPGRSGVPNGSGVTPPQAPTGRYIGKPVQQ